MCKFKSAIVTRNGDIFEYPETDSHEHIIAAHGFRDDGSPLAARSWIRIEFTPPNDTGEITDKDAWTLSVDELSVPDWWEEKKEGVRESLWIRISRSIIADERKCLIGGAWIILPTAKVKAVVGGRIICASGADLSGADLSKANLFRANLSEADLSEADLFRANLYGADLSEADLSEANLSKANLSKANLSGANLSKANLSGANLSKANLFRANLFRANLSKADLSKADLSEADRLLIDVKIDGWKNVNGVLERSNS